MKTYGNQSKGFTLLEVMVVIAIMGVLASIALPNYLAYRQKAYAAHCTANRHYIEMIEREYFVNQDVANLKIDESYKCPSGGVYVWLVSDTNDPGYPKVGCSIHLAQIVSVPEPEPEPEPKPKKPKPEPKNPKPEPKNPKPKPKK